MSRRHSSVLVLVLLATRAAGAAPSVELSLEARVSAQEAQERVYDRHRIWPRSTPKPAFELRVPRSAVEQKVLDSLKKGAVLEERWRERITVEQLNAEMERIARDTKDPAVLRELLASLGNDPVLVGECLVRPLLVDRRIRSRFAQDPLVHDAARQRAARALRALAAGDGDPCREGRPVHSVYTSGDGDRTEASPAPPPGHVSVDQKRLAELRATWGPASGEARLREEEGAIVVARATMERDGAYEVCGCSFEKERFDAWWDRVRMITPAVAPDVPDGHRLPRTMAAAAATSGDVWLERSGLSIPSARNGHSAVWTGSEMIVWGGASYNGNAVGAGSRYDPVTDSWASISGGPGCPSVRFGHTAVWTGTVMIVWGTSQNTTATNTGARYDPLTDSWEPTSTGSYCPTRRSGHSAVWTGREMIIWGGFEYGTIAVRTGGRYDPATDRWTATSLGAASPLPRTLHTAVWTGSEMVVWGGLDASSRALGDGARYDPVTDAWAPVSNAGSPSPRWTHGAVWTGAEMIIWGGASSPGASLDSGARYDPVSDAWAPTPTASGCPTARQGPSAVWTGTEMIVWGGGDGGVALDSGGRYDPVADVWTPVSTGSGHPPGRVGHTAVWTGREMVIWGGATPSPGPLLDDGSRYRPASDSWFPTRSDAPPGLSGGSVVWTGAELIAWGGSNINNAVDAGGRYYPALDTWMPTSTLTAPGARTGHSAVWTGAQMIVWGGDPPTNTGGRYDPTVDAWAPTSVVAAPSSRSLHTAVWTGSQMIVWGRDVLPSGGRYDPSSDTWLPTSMMGAPSARRDHTAVWSGTEMIVWGGCDTVCRDTGGRYDPVADQWTATSTVGAPSGRYRHSAVWTGTEMIVWGGAWTKSGGRYDPGTDSWTPTSTGASCPASRVDHGAVWTGTEMMVWGGMNAGGSVVSTGGRYSPSSDSWRPTSTGRGCPSRRSARTVVWTGSSMIVWAGEVDGMGGIYVPGRQPGLADFVTGSGLGPPNPNRVRVATASGVLTGLDFLAYGAGAWGVNVAGGALLGSGFDQILTGPGPGATLGPQVRGFDDAVPIAKVSYYAFGTLRYGVNVTAGNLDADPYAEMGAGAGSGVVFGPHVRGFEFDGAAVQPIAGINYFAYQTLMYGVHAAFGDVDGDGRAEIVTGPGPGPVFAPHVRGWNHDGAPVTPLPRLSFQAFPVTQYGAGVASASVDADAYAEIAAALGPGPALPASLRGFDYDAVAAAALPGFDVTPFPTYFGARVGLGDVSADGVGDLVAGAGRDPAADATVNALAYDGTALTPLPSTFLAFQTTYGVNVAVGTLGY